MGNAFPPRTVVPEPAAVVILTIAGRIASGKTTLAKALGAVPGTTTAAFGDYVRSVARSRGLNPDRRVLRELGGELVDTGPASFLADVLQFANRRVSDHLILEGLRHLVVWGALLEHRARGGEKVGLVFIDLDADERERRLASRARSSQGVGADLDADEPDLERLRGEANLVVDGRQSVDVLRDLVTETFPELTSTTR